jgi:hypothetical protein
MLNFSKETKKIVNLISLLFGIKICSFLLGKKNILIYLAHIHANKQNITIFYRRKMFPSVIAAVM